MNLKFKGWRNIHIGVTIEKSSWKRLISMRYQWICFENLSEIAFSPLNWQIKRQLSLQIWICRVEQVWGKLPDASNLPNSIQLIPTGESFWTVIEILISGALSQISSSCNCTSPRPSTSLIITVKITTSSGPGPIPGLPLASNRDKYQFSNPLPCQTPHGFMWAWSRVASSFSRNNDHKIQSPFFFLRNWGSYRSYLGQSLQLNLGWWKNVTKATTGAVKRYFGKFIFFFLSGKSRGKVQHH